MKDRKDKTRAPILAAGGIVLRGDRKPQIAVVQLRKLSAWVLPKGKLAASESVIAAARREVLEETGHRVTIHEFLGTLAYEASGRPKVVQFWRMQAIGEPVCDLMRDVKAIQWLALEDAVDQLTHLRERVFLEQVGPIALKSAERSVRRVASGERFARKNLIERAPSAARTVVVERVEPLSPIASPDLAEHEVVGSADLVSATDAVASGTPAVSAGNAREAEMAPGRNVVQKTWVWFRHATLPHRPRLD
jgi:8-oxo-dGTP diphosphatase